MNSTQTSITSNSLLSSVCSMGCYVHDWTCNCTYKFLGNASNIDTGSTQSPRRSYSKKVNCQPVKNLDFIPSNIDMNQVILPWVDGFTKSKRATLAPKAAACLADAIPPLPPPITARSVLLSSNTTNKGNDILDLTHIRHTVMFNHSSQCC
jgi:hypothetical protein